MDAVHCQAWHAIPKAREVYDLEADPDFLPNPIEVPSWKPRKADEPTVCFLGRFDGEKRPELFFEMAERFPDVITSGNLSAISKKSSGRFSPSNLPRKQTVGSSAFLGFQLGTSIGLGRKSGSASRS